MMYEIAEIISIKNELGHFTFGYYPGTAPDMDGESAPYFVNLVKKSWDNPRDPIVYILDVKPEDTARAIMWAVAKQGVEL